MRYRLTRPDGSRRYSNYLADLLEGGSGAWEPDGLGQAVSSDGSRLVDLLQHPEDTA